MDLAEQVRFEQRAAHPQRSTALRVLVVDDDMDTLEGASLLFQLHNYDVRTTCNGHEAVRLALHFRPHLMLLDIGLPRTNGYEVARAIRQSTAADSLTIVAVTGFKGPAIKQRCAEAGFDLHLSKPVDFNVLEELAALLDAKHAVHPRTRERRAAARTCIRSRIETSFILLDAAADSVSPKTKHACVQRALKARNQAVQWLAKDGVVSADERQAFDAPLERFDERYHTLLLDA